MPDAPVIALAPVVAPVVTPWDEFVGRLGFSTVVALLTGILSICWVQNSGITPDPTIATLQLLLAMIVIGCMGVLSFRSADA